MVRSILAVLLVAVFAVGASAYDFLYTGDTPMTHDAGAFGIGGGVMYLMADEVYDHNGDAQEFGADWTAMWIPVYVYYGATDQIELGVNAKFGMLDADEALEGSGLGDTWIWAKYMFLPDPMMSARVGFKVNTGNEPFIPAYPPLDEILGLATGFFGFDEDLDIATGTGQMDIDGAVLFGVPAGPGQFDAAVGYRYRMAQEVTIGDDTWDFIPGNEIHFAAGYTYFISDMMNFGIAADGFFGSEAEWAEWEAEAADDSGTFTDSAANAVWINPSFEYMMENGVTFGVDMQYMLMGQNVLIEWGLGAYIGWGM